MSARRRPSSGSTATPRGVKGRPWAALTVLVLATTPVLAHGGELIIAFVACAWLAPAAVALIAPWPNWKARLLVTLVPVALGAVGLTVLFQTGTDRWPRLIGGGNRFAGSLRASSGDRACYRNSLHRKAAESGLINFTLQLTARRTVARQPSCLHHVESHGVTPPADRFRRTSPLVAAAGAPLGRWHEEARGQLNVRAVGRTRVAKIPNSTRLLSSGAFLGRNACLRNPARHPPVGHLVRVSRSRIRGR